MDKMITRVITKAIVPEGQPMFHERVITVNIEDEAAGEYLAIVTEDGSIKIDPEEWPALRHLMDEMFLEIRAHERQLANGGSL